MTLDPNYVTYVSDVSVLSVPEGGNKTDKIPLPELPSVEAFDFELLPETLIPWAQDIVGRIQCPAEYVGVTIMTALGSVIGRKVGIRPQERTDWTETPNQWALIIGRPGVLKSPAMEQALSPLKRLASRSSERHQECLVEYQQEAKLAKLKAEAVEKTIRTKLKKDPSADVSGLLDTDELEEPILKRYIINDTTAASLGELSRKNPNGLLIHRDEIVSLLKGLDREDNADARGFYLTGWNGNSAYTFDRIGRGLNLYIPAVCLSMLGSTQPGRIAEYLRTAINGGAGDDGLIQRFGLMVWPDIKGTWQDVDRWPDSEARNQAHRVFETLDRIDAAELDAQHDEFDSLPYLRFSNDAQAEFRIWRDAFEAKLRKGDLHPALESHLAKYRKLVPGLALIIHLADGNTGPVGVKSIVKALAWSEYLETHAVRAYSSITAPEVTAAKAILKKLEKGGLPNTFSARDIYRQGWANLSDRKRVHEALQLLSDYGWLSVYEDKTGGRTATIYQVK